MSREVRVMVAKARETMAAAGFSHDGESAAREARRASGTRTAPHAERFASAMERYISAVAQHGASEGSTTRLSFPPSTVADVMNRSVVSAYETALFKEIARALARNRIATVPVIDADHRVVGIVTVSDLLARVVGEAPARGRRKGTSADRLRKMHAATARDLMTSPPITVTPDTSIADAARRAAHHRVRALPVVNRRRELVGMVSRSDLMTVF